MAQPNPQTGPGYSAGAASQSPVPQRQAAGGEKNLNAQLRTPELNAMLNSQISTATTSQPTSSLDPRQPRSPDQPPNSKPDGSGSDWGLAPTKPGISRENKFIIGVLVVLVAVFGFIVFRNFQKKSDAKSDVVAKKDENADEKNAKGETKDDTDKKNGTGDLVADGKSAATESDPFLEQPEVEEGAPKQDATVVGFERETQSTATDDEGVPGQFDPNATAASTGTEEELAGPNIPSTTRRGGRRTHAQPAQDPAPDNEFVGEEPKTLDQTTASSALDMNTEPTTDTTLEGTEVSQTGGIGGTEVAQVDTTFQPPTSPRGTSPRTGAAGPLDPNDPKLGGYREGQLVPSTGAANTAIRQRATASQADAFAEPLLQNTGEYIVRPNDNYWRISRKVYGTARYFAALAKHNEARVPDPKHIKPGIKIATPPKELMEQQYKSLLPVMAAPQPAGAVIDPQASNKPAGYFIDTDGQPAYRVGSTDTLSGISQKTLGRSTRWDEIYELNKDRLAGADTLTVGAILRLPPDASQSRVVGRPVENR